MIVTTRDTTSGNIHVTGRDGEQTPLPDTVRVAQADINDRAITSDDVFDQLEDEDHVVTSGRGSRLPIIDSDGGTAPSGYSAGIGSGSGSD